MKSLEDSRIDKNWKSFLRYRDRRLQGIQTGLQEVDKYLLGLGGITTFQGSTGSNKSTLALQVIHHNLKLGHPAIIIDKENGEGRLRSRLLCQENHISEADIMTCSIDEIKRYREPLLKYPLHIYTESVPDQELVRTRVKECWEMYQKPMIILIDSLQAMTPVDPDQRVNLEKWMAFLDQLKIEHDGNLTILITSEINRSSYDQVGIGSAKGTNSVEFKSETLLDMRVQQNGQITLEICKHRDGLRGARFTLDKMLVDQTNPRSFCFLLTGTTDVLTL